MKILLLNRLIHGFNDLEPVILGLMALDKSFILIGRHGTGKTRLAKWLSQGFGKESFVFYDATKDDLISIAGIPDPESIKSGSLKFIGHERSIWNKTVIVVDEITRAAKENQNLWLEILEERTCFGLPLKYRSIIATANPESYAAAFQLDEALLDRFYAVIPVPEMQSGIDSQDVKQMVNLSMKDGSDVSNKEIVKVFNEIRQAYDELVSENAMDKIARYLGEIIPPILNMLQEQNKLFMSPRTYCRILPEAIMAIASYYKVVGSEEPLQNAALQALRYSVATKLQTNVLALEQHHRSAAVILKGGVTTAREKIKLDLVGEMDYEKQLQYLVDNWSSMVVEMTGDELEKTLKKIYRNIEKAGKNEGLLKLLGVLTSSGYNGDTFRQVRGQISTSLFKAHRKLLPVIQRFLHGGDKVQTQPQEVLDKLARLEESIRDPQFITSSERTIMHFKLLVLRINDKYEKPGIEDIVKEIISSGSRPETL